MDEQHGWASVGSEQLPVAALPDAAVVGSTRPAPALKVVEVALTFQPEPEPDSSSAVRATVAVVDWS